VSLEITIASGKGGTGKTTVSSFLISYLSGVEKRVIGVDADVEAPDLVIALGRHTEIHREEVFDSEIAVINYDRCISCGTCASICRYGAIDIKNGRPVITPELCEGCGVCGYVCPTKAIDIKKTKTGDMIIYDTKFGKVVTGELEIGRKHSGKLVDMLRMKARSIVGGGYIVIDAAAGIGCPVISSIVGVDYLVIVVEPTPQSMLTASKIYEIGKIFNVPMGLIVNKYDLNREFVDEIRRFSEERKVDFLGTVPYDRSIVEAYVNIRSLIEYAPSSSATKSLREIAERLLSRVKG